MNKYKKDKRCFMFMTHIVPSKCTLAGICDPLGIVNFVDMQVFAPNLPPATCAMLLLVCL